MIETLSFLPVLWFILIAVLWAGYLFLEGFDLGIGMLMKTFAGNEKDRRVLLNTVGPVWDGNEVWLITAIGATFAAFPLWYAGLLSAMYVPFAAILLGLILRACFFEYRGKVHSVRWKTLSDWAIAVGSFLAAFGVGAVLGATTTGLPINANGDRVGGPFVWLTLPAVLGGVTAVVWCVVHAAAFAALKTDGPIRHRARALARRLLPAVAVLFLAWSALVGLGLLDGRSRYTWQIPAAIALLVLGLLVAAAAWVALRRGREGWGFAALGVFLLCNLGAIFSGLFPAVLPSTLNANWDLTVISAASGSYTLTLMSVVAAFGVPLVLAYQCWTYWVFRKRVSAAHIPDEHPVIASAEIARTSVGTTAKAR